MTVTVNLRIEVEVSKMKSILKERSRLSVSNVTSADVMLATTGSRGRHWLTSRIPSINVMDHTPEMIQ